MAAPPRGVLPGAVLTRRRPSQDEFNPVPQASSRLGLLPPDGLKYTHDQRGIDRLDGEAADDGARIGGDRVFLLVGVLRVLPACSVGGDIGISAKIKCHALGGFETLLCPFGLSGLDRINVIHQGFAAL